MRFAFGVTLALVGAATVSAESTRRDQFHALLPEDIKEKSFGVIDEWCSTSEDHCENVCHGKWVPGALEPVVIFGYCKLQPQRWKKCNTYSDRQICAKLPGCTERENGKCHGRLRVSKLMHALRERFQDFSQVTLAQQRFAVDAVIQLKDSPYPEDQDRAKWWEPYLDLHEDRRFMLLPFFVNWLTYTPIPAYADQDKSIPSEEHPVGEPNDPSFFITKFDYLANTEVGLELIRDNDVWKEWFIDFMDFRGIHLLSPRSWRNDDFKLWQEFSGSAQHPFKMDDWRYAPEPPHYPSYTHFFLRWFKPAFEGQTPAQALASNRKIGQPDNSLVITTPSDGGYFYLAEEATLEDGIPLPNKSGDEFDVAESFDTYGQYFVGGPLVNCLLWFTDFHHWFAPVTGKLVDIKTYEGSYNYDFYDYDYEDPDQTPAPDSSDKVDWWDRLDKHRRTVFIFETPDLGYVGMAAIGFWGVGSTVITPEIPDIWAGGDTSVPPVQVGDHITKGQYMGHFGYGGSSIVLAFQPQTPDGKDIEWSFYDAENDDTPLGDADHPHQLKARAEVGTATIRDE